MLFREIEIALLSCDMIAGKLIKLYFAEVSLRLDFAPPRSGQNEARTNMQNCRLLRSKVEQKLNMEKIVKMGCFMQNPWSIGLIF